MSHPLDPTLQPETDYTGFINESGEIEIDYRADCPYPWGTIPVYLSVTISYNVTSIDKEGVEVEYKFVGSQNYIPSDFEQLCKDYLYQFPVMRGQSIYKITKS
jgi:hypothetical protein